MTGYSFSPDSKVYVAGHKGLIGSAFMRALEGAGFRDLVTRTHDELELADREAVDAFFEEQRPEVVIMAAGRVGGIVENRDNPADFITENLAIQLNVIRAANASGVRRLVFFGSSCMYPRETEQPMAEEQLLAGHPEPTSIAYAMAKLSGVHMCLAYNRQYGEVRFLPVIPNSAYGPNDNFELGSSHVLSALMRRFHDARNGGVGEVELWGTGSPKREFVHADDIAAACLHLLYRESLEDVEFPLNIGVGEDCSIRDLAEKIRAVVGYEGEILWDTSKPDGAPRKLLDSSRIQALGWKSAVTLDQGLRETYEWFLQNHVAD